MDLSDYLKLDLQGFYKNQGQLFGKRTTTEAKSRNLKNQRKEVRNKLVCDKRQIDSNNISPFITPGPSNKFIDTNKAKMTKRYEMLIKWKEDKLKKQLELKAKSKPIFKVTHIPAQIGLPKLDNVNKLVKGKPITTEDKLKKKYPPTKSEFAPKNYQFKGPQNVMPINIKVPVNKQKVLVKSSRKSNEKKGLPVKKSKKVTMTKEIEIVTPKKQPKIYKKTPAKVKYLDKNLHKSNNKENVEVNRNIKEYDLRNRRIAVNPEFNKQTKKINKVMKTTSEKSDLHLNTGPSTTVNSKSVLSSSSSTVYSVGECINSPQNITPKEKQINVESAPIVYISPFVTINRGKNSARKEFHSRRSKGGLYDSSPDIENNTGPKAGANYFRRLLDNEISRIDSLCNEWNQYKDKQNPPEEACDMINVAIGQSQLLIQKKFKQFRILIDSCENGDSDMPITCQDLHGYWDTAYIQVKNLDVRFENLNKLRSNNWEEIIPQKKAANIKKPAISKPKVQASSRLRDAIRAARDKAKGKVHIDPDKVNNEATNTFTEDLFSIVSPSMCSAKSPIKRTSTRKRKSLLIDVLTNRSSRRESSPGLVMLKATQIAKSAGNEWSNTPSKGILKTKVSESSTKRAKSVLFMEEKINEVPVGKLISFTDSEEETPRKSLRSSRRKKLF